MASPNQRSYIRDLAVQKLKEFKEFKEMLYANGIVSEGAQTVKTAKSVDEILDATTDRQASDMIRVLQAKETPVRPKAYSQKRSEQVIQLLDEIKATADDWSYDGLR